MPVSLPALSEAGGFFAATGALAVVAGGAVMVRDVTGRERTDGSALAIIDCCDKKVDIVVVKVVDRSGGPFSSSPVILSLTRLTTTRVATDCSGMVCKMPQ